MIEVDGRFAGFVFFWILDGFCFVEHFAIESTFRSKGIGSFITVWLEEQYHSLVLEAEPVGTSMEADRRIRFYERAGYRILDTTYWQPAYRVGGSPVCMLLIYKNIDFTKHTSQSIQKEIYQKVYGVTGNRGGNSY